MKVILRILYLLASFVLALFASGGDLSAQRVRVTVFLGGERAEYSFIKVNDEYVGVCDERGEFILDSSALNVGDRMRADFAGLSSDEVEYSRNRSEYSLRISTKELKTSNVSGKEIFLSREYLRVIRKNSFEDPSFGKKYGFRYDMDYSVAEPPTHLRDSFSVELSVIHENGPKDPPLFWETFGVETDTLVTTGVATAWLYAMELFWYVHDAEALMAGSWNKSILFHKVIADDGEIRYAIIEGEKRNNQTIVSLDSSGERLLGVKRAFVGGGTLVETTPRTSHEIELILNQENKKVSISSVRLSVHVPEVNDTRTIIDLDSIRELKMTGKEKDLAWRRLNDYRQARR